MNDKEYFSNMVKRMMDQGIKVSDIYYIINGED